MTRVWRLTKTAAARELNGEDTWETGGRWHSPGARVVYCSSSLALASLECWVHMPPDQRENPSDMSAVLLDVPGGAPFHEIRREDLPEDLDHPEAQALCRAMGDAWLREGKALALIAPSFVVPHENNVMLNADHPMMGEIRIVSVEAFRFDPRMARPDKG